MALHVSTVERVTTLVLDRPQAKNAVDGPTAQALFDAFVAFDRDPDADVAVLAGASDTFCAGADLKAVALGMGEDARANPIDPDMRAIAPMGCTRLVLSKPVIAAISGYAVAGGIELALWCDLRVVEETATLGVFCRRWGVPLIDGGTVRLPRLIGQSRALDLILTGRPVPADEALAIGLANRVVPAGTARDAAIALARQLADFPQATLRADRLSALTQWDWPLPQALQREWDAGKHCLGDALAGAARFAGGAGRHGRFDEAE